MVKRH